MHVYRFIFRLDFKPVFDIFDSPGQIMRTLLTEKLGDEKFFPDLLEDTKTRAITARYTSEDKKQMRTLTVEPMSIHGSFETVDGVALDSIENYEILRKLFKIVNRFREIFHINSLERCGARFFCFDSVGNSTETSVQKIKALINSGLSKSIEETLGGIQDIGFAFDGEHEDKIKYKFKCGPYSTEGKDKYFSQITKPFDTDLNHDLIFDIDMFEEKFVLNESVSFFKWCAPIIKKVSTMVNATKDMLT